MAESEFTSKLLREAIADAEAVRQTAIENAKLSLEEKFTPQIKSMFEARLRAEADVEGEDATELPHEDGEAEGSSEFPADDSEIGDAENKEPSDEADDSSEIGTGPEAETDSSTDWYDDWSESDFDLKEVIAELENDVDMLEKDSEDDDEEVDGEEEEGEEEGEGEEEMEAGEEEEKEGEEEMEAGEEEEGEGKMKLTFEEFMKMIQEAGYGLEEMAASKDYPDADAVHSDETPQDSSEIGDGGENVEQSDLNLEEILAMLEAEDASIQEESEPSEEMASETKALQEELAEYRQAVNILRGKLNEVNLLNAKLLFTNKIFRKEGLTNEQKITIVENFDRATSVREVKMVYAVLAETLTVDAKQSKVKLPRKVVAEGLASKPMKSTAPTVNTAEIISENSFTKRLQQLAGII